MSQVKPSEFGNKGRVLRNGITWGRNLLKSKSRSIRLIQASLRHENIQIIARIMLKKRLARQAQVQQTERPRSKRTIWWLWVSSVVLLLKTRTSLWGNILIGARHADSRKSPLCSFQSGSNFWFSCGLRWASCFITVFRKHKEAQQRPLQIPERVKRIVCHPGSWEYSAG